MGVRRRLNCRRESRNREHQSPWVSGSLDSPAPIPAKSGAERRKACHALYLYKVPSSDGRRSRSIIPLLSVDRMYPCRGTHTLLGAVNDSESLKSTGIPQPSSELTSCKARVLQCSTRNIWHSPHTAKGQGPRSALPCCMHQVANPCAPGFNGPRAISWKMQVQGSPCIGQNKRGEHGRGKALDWPDRVSSNFNVYMYAISVSHSEHLVRWRLGAAWLATRQNRMTAMEDG